MNPSRKTVEDNRDSAEAKGDIAKYGIEYRVIDQFVYRDFKYTKLADAISQAKRDDALSEKG